MKNDAYCLVLIFFSFGLMNCKTNGLQIIPTINNSFAKGDPRADLVDFKNTYSCTAQILGLADSSCVILIENNENLKNSFYRIKLESNLPEKYCGLRLSTATIAYLKDNPELKMITLRDKQHYLEVHFEKSNFLNAQKNKKEAVLAYWVAFYRPGELTFNKLAKLSSQKERLSSFKEIY